MEQPSYYAIIPASVRYDNDLTANAKLLYGEITALCGKDGKCTAKNKYFAELYGVSNVSVSKWIALLSKNNYISVEIIYKEGTKEILNRYLTLVNDPIKEKFKDNNTRKNKKENNIKENSELEILFNKFWKAYPKRKSKGDAEKWFLKYKPTEELINIMIEKIELLKKTDQWKNDNGQYIPYPSSWLNSKGWEDEIEVSSKPITEKRFFN